jgi:hypothetical protein
MTGPTPLAPATLLGVILCWAFFAAIFQPMPFDVPAVLPLIY